MEARFPIDAVNVVGRVMVRRKPQQAELLEVPKVKPIYLPEFWRQTAELV